MICMQGALDYADRLAKLAFEKAKSAPTPERRAELTEIARICAKVPRKAPDTFYEALQFVLFIHLMIQMESNGHSISWAAWTAI